MKTILNDDSGNQVITERNGDVVKVYLHLHSETRNRKVGVIDCKEKILTVKRKPTHLHYKSNSYGFNHMILDRAKLFEKVKLITHTGEYLIPKKDILELGRFLFFKQQGFERQIFLSLDYIYNYKIQPTV